MKTKPVTNGIEFEFKIEQGIPIPSGTARDGRRVYPFYEMKVGDSFLVPKEKSGSARISTAGFNRRNKDKYFAARMQKDGLRIWRTK